MPHFVVHLPDYNARLNVYKTHLHMHLLRFQCGIKASVLNLGQYFSFFYF